MSDIEKLFLAAYPLWPKQLLGKFASLLSLEVAKFNPKIEKSIVDEYYNIPSKIKIQVLNEFANDSIIFTPANASKIISVSYGRFEKRPLYRRRPLIEHDFENGQFGFIHYFGKLSYDKRLFSSVAVSDVELIYYVAYATDYIPGWTSPNEYYEYLNYDAYLILNILMNNYNGAASVLAMAENGIPTKYNTSLLSEFVTFLNAYNKFSGQLSAENSLQAEKNKQDLQQYKNVIFDKLTNRKSELSDMKAQIMFAARNETASAKRDMQQLSLSAQSLLIQVKEKISSVLQ